ncbi:unnamed protein product [Calypogeia fissa]
MAGRIEEMTTRRSLLSRRGVLKFSTISFFTIFMNILTSSYSQSGFLSIDCGSTRAMYNDSLGLEWVTDNGTYITTGISYEQSYVNWTFLNSSAGAKMEALQSFTYFPDSRSKYCYELETQPTSSYLIRASFYMNVYEQNMRAPFQFVAHLNGTQWFTLISNGSEGNDFFVTQEAIFNSPARVIYFCLQPVVGMPFISSLELRRLAPTMYSYGGSNVQYLSLLYRYNLGPTSTIPKVVRFPDDSYDRIWEQVQWQDDMCGSPFPSTSCRSCPVPQDTTIRADVNYVPPKVMQDAYMFLSHDGWLDSFSLSFYTDRVPEVYLPPLELAYVIVYAENLISSDIKHSYSYNIILDINTAFGQISGVVNVSNRASMLAIPNHLIVYASSITFSIPTSTNDLPLNAAEAFAQYSFNYSTTSSDDDNFIKVLKKNRSLTDWHGDPCSPVPYDWLTCICTSCYSDQDTNQQRTSLYEYAISSLTVSNVRTSGLRFFQDQAIIWPTYLENL